MNTELNPIDLEIADDKKNYEHINLEAKDNYLKFSNYLIYGGLALIVVGFLFQLEGGKANSEFLGAFGEYIGGVVGSFWTLAGVLLFYSALNRQGKEFLLQREQLELQRYELAQQREELKLQRYETELQRLEFERQTEQLKEQNLTLSIQKFENTFFQLLGLQNEIVNSNESRDLGKDWAKKLYLRFMGKYQRLSENNNNFKELIDESYRLFPKRLEYLDRYFNNLYYLIEFINKSRIEDKIFYTSIVRAQLTVYEQLLLFYFSISSLAPSNIIELIETYQLIKDLPMEELIDSNHKSFINANAFGLINF